MNGAYSPGQAQGLSSGCVPWANEPSQMHAKFTTETCTQIRVKDSHFDFVFSEFNLEMANFLWAASYLLKAGYLKRVEVLGLVISKVWTILFRSEMFASNLHNAIQA